ncbi:MAG: hypothetical protein ACI4VF_07660 [Lachnospirales bacterium]
MFKTIRKITEEFNINAVNIYKCKYYFVINSPQGSFSLSVARPSKERIEIINREKNLLENAGFYLLDSFILTKSGKPYLEYEGQIFTLSKYFGNSELDILSNIQSSIALETIGSLSKAVKNISLDTVYAANLNTNILNLYKKQILTLKKAKKRLSPNKEFDHLILKFIPKILEKAEKSFNNLEKLNYGSEITICHSSLKEGNIIYNKGKCVIIDWDNLKYRHFLEDPAFFIKRYIRKNAFYTLNTKANSMSLEELIKSYTKNYKPTQNEMDILYELLIYPHRLISLICEYLSKNRGFVPSGLSSKIKECIEEWDFTYKYIG